MMKFKNLPLLGASLFLLLSFHTSQSAPASICFDLFKRSHLLPQRNEPPSSTELKTIAAILQERAQRNREELFKKLSQSPKKNVKYDVVIVGAGPHGAIAAMALARQAPHLRVLMLSRASTVASVFDNIGSTMWINSPELPDGRSSNSLPGSNLSIRSVGEPQQAFKLSSDMASVISYGIYESGVDIVLNTSVELIEALSSGKEKIWLNDQQSITARGVIVATGLGPAKLGMTDIETQNLISFLRKAETGKPSLKGRWIEFFDDVKGRWNSLTQDGPKNIVQAYSNKDILIIGDGDASNVLIEDLTGLGRAQLYGSSNLKNVGDKTNEFGIGDVYGVKSLDVSNLKFNNENDFKQKNKKRYHETVAPLIGQGVHGRPKTIALRAVYTHQQITKIVATFEDGSTRAYDHVFIASGYKNNVMDLFSHSAEKTFHILNQSGSVVALGVQGHRHLAIVGPAAGKIASQEDLDRSITKNDVSINVMAPKTSSLMDLFINGLLGNTFN